MMVSSHTMKDKVEFIDCFLCIGMKVGGTTGYNAYI